MLFLLAYLGGVLTILSPCILPVLPFVFARADRPLDAVAAAPLSAAGTYGPLVVISNADTLDAPVDDYLLDIQPGYSKDPVRGVYNHGWIIGDDRAISVPTQARIDSLLEITKAQNNQQSP